MQSKNLHQISPRHRAFREEVPLEVKMREKRRSPRVNSCVPVRVEWTENAPAPAKQEEAQTRVVNFYGCLLVSRSTMPIEQRLRITNLATQQSIGAVVVWQGKKRMDGWELGVELVEPRTDFWGMEF